MDFPVDYLFLAGVVLISGLGLAQIFFPEIMVRFAEQPETVRGQRTTGFLVLGFGLCGLLAIVAGGDAPTGPPTP